MAKLWAEVWLKLPEIWTWPPKDVKVDWLGSVSGADWTTPSSSIVMISWKYCWASESHSLAPAEVRVMLTTQAPVWLSWATADFTMWPVSLAGPARYRTVPLGPFAIPGRSTVAL